MIVTLINSEEKNHPNIPTLLHAVLWIYRKEKWWDICNITKNVTWNEMHWNVMIFLTLAAQIFNMKKDSSNLTEDNLVTQNYYRHICYIACHILFSFIH